MKLGAQTSEGLVGPIPAPPLLDYASFRLTHPAVRGAVPPACAMHADRADVALPLVLLPESAIGPVIPPVW